MIPVFASVHIEFQDIRHRWLGVRSRGLLLVGFSLGMYNQETRRGAGLYTPFHGAAFHGDNLPSSCGVGLTPFTTGETEVPRMPTQTASVIPSRNGDQSGMAPRSCHSQSTARFSPTSMVGRSWTRSFGQLLGSFKVALLKTGGTQRPSTRHFAIGPMVFRIDAGQICLVRGPIPGIAFGRPRSAPSDRTLQDTLIPLAADAAIRRKTLTCCTPPQRRLALWLWPRTGRKARRAAALHYCRAITFFSKNNCLPGETGTSPVRQDGGISLDAALQPARQGCGSLVAARWRSDLQMGILRAY